MVLFLEDGRHISRMIPKDATISTEGKTFNGDKLVEVIWEDMVVMMFTQDIRSRSTQLVA